MSNPTDADIIAHLEAAAAAIGNNQAADAERHLAAVLKSRPDAPDALQMLGLIRHHQGRRAEALDLVSRAVAARPEAPDYASNLANLHLSAGDTAAARAALDDALARTPGHPGLLYDLGRVAILAGDPGAALDHLVQAAEAAPQAPEVFGALGVVYQQMGDGANARAAYETAIELGSRDADDRFNLGTVCMNAREWDKAIALFEEATKLNPDHQRAHADIGLIHGRNADYAAALDPLRRAVALAPDNARSVNELIYAEAIVGDPLAGIKTGEAFLKVHPEMVDLHHQVAFAYLQAGQPENAVKAADRGIDRGVHPTTALAIKSAALNVMGERRAAAELLDFDRLIMTKVQKAPAGYASLDDFNRALVDDLLNDPTLEYATTNRSMEKGRGTMELFDGNETGPVLALKGLIMAMARAYMTERPADPGHPFLAKLPADLHPRCWGNIYDREGRQRVHFHPPGWLSGVYYPALPDSMKDGTASEAEGCIEFGRAAHMMRVDDDPPVRLVRPEEGMMVLFPSYVGHQTIPVTSSDSFRVSIAFDLEPLDAAD